MFEFTKDPHLKIKMSSLDVYLNLCNFERETVELFEWKDMELSDQPQCVQGQIDRHTTATRVGSPANKPARDVAEEVAIIDTSPKNSFTMKKLYWEK